MGRCVAWQRFMPDKIEQAMVAYLRHAKHLSKLWSYNQVAPPEQKRPVKLVLANHIRVMGAIQILALSYTSLYRGISNLSPP